MNTKRLKITAIVIGIISFLYSVYVLIVVISFARTVGNFDIRIISGDTTFTCLFFSPLSTIGLWVASFGLYRGKKWGHILSNLSLLIFLGGSILVVANNYFPNLLDSEVQLDSGWFVFYHMELSLETITAPVIAATIVVLLNLKSTRRVLYG